MGLSGHIAGGMQSALNDVLDRRLREEIRRFQETQAKEALALQERQIAGVEADRAANRENQRRLVDLAELKRTDDLASDATDRNVGMDAANVMGMPGMTPEARASELQQSVLRNPTAKSGPAMLKMIEGLTKVTPKRFTPPQKLADGSIGQFEEGQIPTGTKFYQEPKTPAGPKTPPAPAKLPVGMATAIAAAKTSLAGLDRLETLYSDDKVGPIAGRYNSMERGAPQMISGMLKDAPKDFEEFAAESATLKNQVIQAITGAAVGVKEQGRIMEQIPDVTNNPSVWKAKAKATRRNLEALMANQTQMGTGAQEAAPGASVDAQTGGAAQKPADLIWNGKAFVKPGGE